MSRSRPVSPNVLLVEGSTDREFIYQLSNRAAIPRGTFDIPKEDERSGVDALVASLQGELVASGLKRLGIVIDADENLIGRWTSVRDRLRTLDYTSFPALPTTEGVIHREPGKSVVIGVWLMPDNATPGVLEDFAAGLVHAGDELWARAADVVAQIPASQRRFKSAYESKARMHTWLAWQEEPGTPLGLALKRQYLSADARPAAQFIAWLKRLFELP